MTYDPTLRVPFGGPPPKKRRTGLWIAVGTIAAIMLFFCAIAAFAPKDDKAAPPAHVAEQPAETTAASKAPAKPKAATLGAGTWEVGTEVKPGTYTTTATDGCYWARLKSFDGDLDSIIANGNLDPGQRGRLTVKASDKGLELTGGCEWKRAG